MPDLEPAEVLAAALWNTHEGYSVTDKQGIGRSPFDWVSPDPSHPDDIADRQRFLGYAAAALRYLAEAGWEFRSVASDA